MAKLEGYTQGPFFPVKSCLAGPAAKLAAAQRAPFCATFCPGS